MFVYDLTRDTTSRLTSAGKGKHPVDYPNWTPRIPSIRRRQNRRYSCNRLPMNQCPRFPRTAAGLPTFPAKPAGSRLTFAPIPDPAEVAGFERRRGISVVVRRRPVAVLSKL